VIPAEQSHLHVAAQSHPGMSGKNNEDRYAVSAFRLSDVTPLPVVFAIVSDGIGGHRAGEVAAEIAVETISRVVASSDASQPVNTLKEAIIQASQAIYAASENGLEMKGMGATCACAWIIDDRIYTANVGDSRIYLIRGTSILRLSTDHTWIQEALNAGLLTPKQARGHPNAHIIRRYLGSQQTVEPDLRLRMSPAESDAQSEANQGLRLLPDDQLVLCSDGLTDLVSEAEILNTFRHKDQTQAIEALVHLANRRGGHDNITVVALQVPAAAPKITPVAMIQPPRSLNRNLKWACLVAVILIIFFGTILLAGAYLLKNRLSNPSTATSVVLPSQPAVLPGVTSTAHLIQSSTPVPGLTSIIIPTATNPVVSLSPQATHTDTPWPTSTKKP
jgi:serine/threonine protein phosphatase PrpC